MTINFALSPAKADRLYWLGRYSERVCAVMHLLRKYYDAIIDDRDTMAHREFCERLGIPCSHDDARAFVDSFLYDAQNNFSVINMLERVKDNAILLREDIKSETLAYVEMAINFMKESETKGRGLYDLQFVTDSIFAFFGALEERVQNTHVRNLIRIGIYIEKTDLYIRFGYSAERISEIFCRLEAIDERDRELCNPTDLMSIRQRIERCEYNSPEMNPKLNTLFAA